MDADVHREGEAYEWAEWGDAGPKVDVGTFEPDPDPDGDTERFGTWTLTERLIPEAGKFVPAQLEIELAFSETRPDIEPRRGDRQTVQILDATISKSYAFGTYYNVALEDEQGEAGLLLEVQPEPFPEWFDEEGDECYLTLLIEYLHEATRARKDYTETDIEQRRERDREWIRELRDRAE